MVSVMVCLVPNPGLMGILKMWPCWRHNAFIRLNMYDHIPDFLPAVEFEGRGKQLQKCFSYNYCYITALPTPGYR